MTSVTVSLALPSTSSSIPSSGVRVSAVTRSVSVVPHISKGMSTVVVKERTPFPAASGPISAVWSPTMFGSASMPAPLKATDHPRAVDPRNS